MYVCVRALRDTTPHCVASTCTGWSTARVLSKDKGRAHSTGASAVQWSFARSASAGARKTGRRWPPMPPGQRIIANAASLGATATARGRLSKATAPPSSTAAVKATIALRGTPADDACPAVLGQKRPPQPGHTYRYRGTYSREKVDRRKDR